MPMSARFRHPDGASELRTSCGAPISSGGEDDGRQPVPVAWRCAAVQQGLPGAPSVRLGEPPADDDPAQWRDLARSSTVEVVIAAITVACVVTIGVLQAILADRTHHG